MNFGLREEDLEYIEKSIQQFMQIDKAVIFGSRALEKHRNGSDVDIAIMGENVNIHVLSRLHTILEDESPMPYFFDIVDYTHLEHDALKQHIDRVGKTIYLKSS